MRSEEFAYTLGVRAPRRDAIGGELAPVQDTAAALIALLATGVAAEPADPIMGVILRSEPRWSPVGISCLSWLQAREPGAQQGEEKRWRLRLKWRRETWHKKVAGSSWCTSISTFSTRRSSTSGTTRNIYRN